MPPSLPAPCLVQLRSEDVSDVFPLCDTLPLLAQCAESLLLVSAAAQ